MPTGIIFKMRWPRRYRGFTLIEMVSVIMLLGILAAASTAFIGSGVNIYVDSARRTVLAQQGRFAVERISREVRNALPGSVRASDDGTTYCLEFMPIIAGSSYTNNLAATAVTTVEAVFHADLTTVQANDRLAIYAVDNASVYAPGSLSLATIASVNTTVNPSVITLNAGHTFPLDSPQQRFYIVRNPVSYCAVDGILTRHAAYTPVENQPLPPTAGNADTLAEHIRLADAGAVVPFQYTAGVLQRTGVVHLDLRFRDDDEATEWVRFSHEVFVRNAH